MKSFSQIFLKLNSTGSLYAYLSLHDPGVGYPPTAAPAHGGAYVLLDAGASAPANATSVAIGVPSYHVDREWLEGYPGRADSPCSEGHVDLGTTRYHTKKNIF